MYTFWLISIFIYMMNGLSKGSTQVAGDRKRSIIDQLLDIQDAEREANLNPDLYCDLINNFNSTSKQQSHNYLEPNYQPDPNTYDHQQQVNHNENQSLLSKSQSSQNSQLSEPSAIIQDAVQQNRNQSWSAQPMNTDQSISLVPTSQLPPDQSSFCRSFQIQRSSEQQYNIELAKLCNNERQSHYVKKEEILSSVRQAVEQITEKYVGKINFIGEEIRYKLEVVKEYRRAYKVFEYYLSNKEKEMRESYQRINSQILQTLAKMSQPSNYCGFKNKNELILAQILAKQGYISPKTLKMPPKTSNKLTEVLKQAKFNHMKKSNFHLHTYIEEEPFMKNFSTSHHSENETNQQPKETLIFPNLDKLKNIKELQHDQNSQIYERDQQIQQNSNKCSLSYSKNNDLGYSNQYRSKISDIQLEKNDIQQNDLLRSCRPACEDFQNLEADLDISSQQPESVEKSELNFTQNPQRHKCLDQEQSTFKNILLSQKLNTYQQNTSFNPTTPSILPKREGQGFYLGMNSIKLKNMLKSKQQGQNNATRAQKTVSNEDSYIQETEKSRKVYRHRRIISDNLRDQREGLPEKSSKLNNPTRQRLQILREHCQSEAYQNEPISKINKVKPQKSLKMANHIKNQQIYKGDKCKYPWNIFVQSRNSK